MRSRILGTILLLISAGIFATVAYRNSHRSQTPVVFSSKAMLGELWNSYKKEYLEPGSNRTLDKQRDNVTTSEGQSYTMFRAVLQDDKDTFDKSWTWTKDNLKRPDDHLFAWLYGEKSDGSYGVITERGGQNTATDGDEDVALSLIFAYSRWDDNQYLIPARQIVSDIWEKEVVTINGTPYLAANNLEKESKKDMVVNPSYMAPYAYRIFAKIDHEHDWNKLVDSSYLILDKASSAKLNTGKSASLPPDWMVIDRATGELKASDLSNLTTNYSYDAMRIPWRLALDYQWNNESRAKTQLGKFNLIDAQWKQNNAIYSTYSHDGNLLKKEEAPSIYGGNLGYFIVEDPQAATTIYTSKLQSLYDPAIQSWKKSLGYYDDNWAWFGMALYNKEIINLGANL